MGTLAPVIPVISKVASAILTAKTVYDAVKTRRDAKKAAKRAVPTSTATSQHLSRGTDAYKQGLSAYLQRLEMRNPLYVRRHRDKLEAQYQRESDRVNQQKVNP